MHMTCLKIYLALKIRFRDKECFLTRLLFRLLYRLLKINRLEKKYDNMLGYCLRDHWCGCCWMYCWNCSALGSVVSQGPGY